MFIQTPDIALGNIQLAGNLTTMEVSDKSLLWNLLPTSRVIVHPSTLAELVQRCLDHHLLIH